MTGQLSEMARIRSIWPEACKSERLASVSAEAERCYWRLQTHCDDEGRCEDHPRLIWAALFPLHEDVTHDSVHQWLDELNAAGLIERYKVDDEKYIAVTQWERFQHPQRPRPSTLPAPTGNGTRYVRESSRTPRGDVLPGEGEGEGTGEGDGALAADAARTAKRRAIPLPDDWEPSEATKDWVRREYPAYAKRGVVESFKDHARAKGRVLRDWDAGLRNWVRNEAKFHPTPEERGPTRTHL